MKASQERAFFQWDIDTLPEVLVTKEHMLLEVEIICPDNRGMCWKMHVPRKGYRGVIFNLCIDVHVDLGYG
jgi:hypothetical protein